MCYTDLDKTGRARSIPDYCHGPGSNLAEELTTDLGLDSEEESVEVFMRMPAWAREREATLMANLNLRPLNDKIVVKRLEAEDKTKGGIFLPDNAKEKPSEGRVMALGDGKLLKDGKRANFQVSKNDRVIFSSYAGTQIKVEGEEYLIMSEDDVLAIVD